jgi:hypothetical protein
MRGASGGFHSTEVDVIGYGRGHLVHDGHGAHCRRAPVGAGAGGLSVRWRLPSCWLVIVAAARKGGRALVAGCAMTLGANTKENFGYYALDKHVDPAPSFFAWAFTIPWESSSQPNLGALFHFRLRR